MAEKTKLNCKRSCPLRMKVMETMKCCWAGMPKPIKGLKECPLGSTLSEIDDNPYKTGEKNE